MIVHYIMCVLVIAVTVVPATSGHLRFGAKVAPRGRERKFMTSSQKHTYIHTAHN